MHERPVDRGPLSFDSWSAVHDPGVDVARQRSIAAAELLAHGVEPNVHPDAGAPLQLNGAEVRVGTASWTDPTLLQSRAFYPGHANNAERRLRYYASRFPLVEIDSTFYAMPSRANAERWAERTPDHFMFDVKAFALMTGHRVDVRRLPDWLRSQLPASAASETAVGARDLDNNLQDQVWQRFLGDLEPLRDAGKLGPILLQYPHWFTPTRESADELRLARERLGNARAAVEFRNPDWVTGRIAPRTFALLEKLQFTYVIVDAPPGTRSSMPPVAAITTPDLAVIRLHGRRTDTWEVRQQFVSERYRYLYDRAALREWAARVDDITSQLSSNAQSSPQAPPAKRGVHIVFNNCHANYGIANADEFSALLVELDGKHAAADSTVIKPDDVKSS